MVGRFTWKHALKVVLVMGWSDFVLKYRGSFLGYLWSLAGPLVKFLVILYVFGPFVSPEIPEYPLYLFLGIIMWEHFVLTTSSCITALIEKASIVQTMIFPRILLMLTAGWTNMIIFFTHFVIFCVFALLLRVPLHFAQLLFVLILFHMFFIAVGIGMLLSAYSLKYRDIPHLWGIISQTLFWLTPIMYQYQPRLPLSQAFMELFLHPLQFSLRSVFDVFVQFQPLSILVYDARRILLYREIPSWTHFVWFTLICIGLFAFAAVIFQRRSRDFLQ